MPMTAASQGQREALVRSGWTTESTGEAAGRSGERGTGGVR
jgi:hypothetical protein